MNNLSNYIIEKLKIDKDIEVRKIIPTKDDFDKIDKLFNSSLSNSLYYSSECEDIAKSCKHKISAIKLWLAMIQKTNSTPYIFKDTINSFPGNFGKEFIDKAIKLGATTEEIMFQYDLNNDKEKHNIPKKLEKSYNDMIDSLLSSPKHYLDDNKLSFELNYHIDTDGDNYTDEARNIINKRNGIIVLPFIVKYYNKKVQCEIGYVGNSFYFYSIDGKKIGTASLFQEALLKYLD